MIVKDEEETLGRCLGTVADIVDEIIIVDTGSADRTKAIANDFGTKIYDFEWIDDFAAARNFSFAKATMDYVLWLDADDVITEEDRAKFKQLKESLDPSIDVVMMKYNLGVDEKGNATCTFFRERLLKRSRQFRWYDPIHEYMLFSGNIVNSDIGITHRKMGKRSRRNLEIFEKMIAAGQELSSRNFFYYARELYHNGHYNEAIIYFNKFLDSENGYLSNYIDACIDLAKAYLLVSQDKAAALRALLRSFEYDTPRAEICCELGYLFKGFKDYQKAIFWFELASRIPKPQDRWGSVSHDCYDYIPYMELCACHYKLGNLHEASQYNLQAAVCKPDDPLVLHNIEFLNTINTAACATGTKLAEG